VQSFNLLKMYKPDIFKIFILENRKYNMITDIFLNLYTMKMKIVFKK